MNEQLIRNWLNDRESEAQTLFNFSPEEARHLAMIRYLHESHGWYCEWMVIDTDGFCTCQLNS